MIEQHIPDRIDIISPGPLLSHLGCLQPTGNSMSVPHKHTTTPGKATYQDLLAEINELTAGLQALREQGIEALTPVVQALVGGGSRDVQRIEHTLDQLLDVACLPEGQVLFKTLCRHYGGVDPQATASYINAYREMWEDDEQGDTDEVVP